MIPALQNNQALARRRLRNHARRTEAVRTRDRTVSECSIPHCPMLDAVEGPVKRYYAQLGYINEAPRSKLRGILINSPKPLPSFSKATEGSPRLYPLAALLR